MRDSLSEMGSAMLATFKASKVPSLGFELAQMFASLPDTDITPADDFTWLNVDEYLDQKFEEDPEFEVAYMADAETLIEQDDDGNVDFWSLTDTNEEGIPGWGTGIQWSDLHFSTIRTLEEV